MIRQEGSAARKWMPLVVTVVVAACGGGDDGSGATSANDMRIADVGFMTPESVLMDTAADVYLVSNINGGPTDEDDNGFISRVNPDGTVENLRWIDGAAGLFPLHAPKGMAISGDTLFVADITCIRMFNRTTGEFFSDLCLEGTSFLNDVAIGPEGSIFVTDTGVRAGAAGLEPAGTDAIYRLPRGEGQRGATLARDAELGGPNGIAIGPRGIFVVTFGSGEVLRFTAGGEKSVLLPASSRQYDGIVFLNDGSFAFSATSSAPPSSSPTLPAARWRLR
jgi:sugar lactone lactonase YvrE